MKQFISSLKSSYRVNRDILSVITICLVLAITSMAFQDPTKVNIPLKKAVLDSPPENTNIKIEIDLKEIEQSIKKSMELVDKRMKDIDWSAMQKQIQESLKNVDLATIQIDVNKLMKDVDLSKFKFEFDASKMADMDKLKVDLDKMKTELKLAMKDFNSEDLKKEMEKVKKEMEKNKDQLKIELEKTKLDMETVKEGLTGIKEMTTEMEKDGLINKTERNEIEFRNKELYINGKKQSPEITEKYRKYFKGERFTR